MGPPNLLASPPCTGLPPPAPGCVSLDPPPSSLCSFYGEQVRGLRQHLGAMGPRFRDAEVNTVDGFQVPAHRGGRGWRLDWRGGVGAGDGVFNGVHTHLLHLLLEAEGGPPTGGGGMFSSPPLASGHSFALTFFE